MCLVSHVAAGDHEEEIVVVNSVVPVGGQLCRELNGSSKPFLCFSKSFDRK